jgi:hypothetical protein
MTAEALLRRTYGLAKPPDDAETVAWRKDQSEKMRQRVAANRVARGVASSPNFTRVPAARPEPRTFIHSSVPPALLKKAQVEAPEYAAEFKCVVTQPVLLTELPLVNGARGGRDSTEVRILQLHEEARKIALNPEGNRLHYAAMLFTAPFHRVTGLWMANTVAAEVHNPMRGEIWTVNRATGDVMRMEGYSLQAVRGAIVAGVQLGWNQVQLGSGTVVRNGAWVNRDPQWPEHTSLAVVSEELVDYVTLTGRADRVEFLPSIWVEEPAAIEKVSQNVSH